MSILWLIGMNFRNCVQMEILMIHIETPIAHWLGMYKKSISEIISTFSLKKITLEHENDYKSAYWKNCTRKSQFWLALIVEWWTACSCQWHAFLFCRMQINTRTINFISNMTEFVCSIVCSSSVDLVRLVVFVCSPTCPPEIVVGNGRKPCFNQWSQISPFWNSAANIFFMR